MIRWIKTQIREGPRPHWTPGPGAHLRISAGLASNERIAVYFEHPCFPLTASAAEGVAGGPNLDVDKTRLFEHPLPACARQATGDSSSPQIDVTDSRLGHGFGVSDIGELQPSARSQHAQDLCEDLTLVSAQIDDAVADYHVRPVVFDG